MHYQLYLYRCEVSSGVKRISKLQESKTNVQLSSSSWCKKVVHGHLVQNIMELLKLHLIGEYQLAALPFLTKETANKILIHLLLNELLAHLFHHTVLEYVVFIVSLLL